MLRLSEELGQDVWTADGERLGRLVDLVIADHGDAPLVHAVVVRVDRTPTIVSWAHVTSFEHTGVTLATGTVAPLPADAHELWLDRDVLDAQIVDIEGHRLVRCGDVLLTRQADDTLVVVGVDVGFGAVVRRLGLRSLARRFDPEVVAWRALHLTSRHGHKVQLETRRARLERLSSEDLAHVLARLSVRHAGDVLEQTSVARTADAIAASHDEVGHRLLAALPEQRADDVLDALPVDRSRRFRSLLSRTARPRRRYHRSRGWRRHAPRHRPDGPPEP